MPSNQSVVLCAVEASHGSCGKPVETNLAELAGTDFSTLCRRQKTLSIAIPYQGAGGLTCPRGSLIHNESLRVWVSYSSSSVWASAACAEPSNCSSARLASTGVWFSRDECGLTLLSSYRQRASLQQASSNISKISSFNSSSHRLP